MKKKKAGKKDITGTIILLMALLIFAYALVRLGMIFMEYGKGQQSYQKLDEFIDNNQKEEAEGSAEDFSVDFAGLKKINPEVIGWIRLESMDISYPIMHTTDNEYYLTHSFNKEELKCGSIFMEAENAADFSDDNTFIYGHNMKDKSMFAKLNQFKEEKTYKENPEFFIYTEERILRYRIFSCYETKTSGDSFTYQFADAQAYGQWLKTVKDRSLYDTGLTPALEQKTVTLMTCTPSGADYRFLVHGVLTEETILKEK